MRAAPLLAALVFALVAAAHLLRLVLRVEVLVAGAALPMWVSVLGLVIPAALAFAFWKEAQPTPVA